MAHKNRVVMYLDDPEFADFKQMAKSLHLTHSAYCRLQNGFDSSVKAGAPKGNQNSKKKRRKRSKKQPDKQGYEDFL